MGGQIPAAFTQISVHFLLPFVLQLQLLMVAAREVFNERCSGSGENTNSQCDDTHSLKGTCDQNSLTPRCTEDSVTWNLTK